jgi:hypothetical protein
MTQAKIDAMTGATPEEGNGGSPALAAQQQSPFVPRHSPALRPLGTLAGMGMANPQTSPVGQRASLNGLGQLHGRGMMMAPLGVPDVMGHSPSMHSYQADGLQGDEEDQDVAAVTPATTAPTKQNP